jgi:hypothetical protein
MRTIDRLERSARLHMIASRASGGLLTTQRRHGRIGRAARWQERTTETTHSRRNSLAALFLRRSPCVGMPDIPAHVHWQPYTKHRVKTWVWDQSEARRSSGEGGPAKYNPRVFQTDQQIEAIERRCLTDGIVVHHDGVIATCYMLVDQKEPYVGVCSGEFTHFIWVEMNCRTFHGRPISLELLRTKLRRRGLPLP